VRRTAHGTTIDAACQVWYTIRDMRRAPFRILLLLAAGLAAGCAPRAPEGPPVLDAAAVDEAIVYGRLNVEKPFNEFVADWTVDMPYEQGKGRAVLMTPFLTVALLGQKSAARNVEIDRRLVERILRREAGTLRFFVTVYGSEPDFTRSLVFRLKAGGREIPPSAVSMPRYGDFTRDYYNVASGTVVFPSAGVGTGSTVVLAVTFPREEGDKEPRVCEFPFDLSRFR